MNIHEEQILTHEQTKQPLWKERSYSDSLKKGGNIRAHMHVIYSNELFDKVFC